MKLSYSAICALLATCCMGRADFISAPTITYSYTAEISSYGSDEADGSTFESNVAWVGDPGVPPDFFVETSGSSELSGDLFTSDGTVWMYKDGSDPFTLSGSTIVTFSFTLYEAARISFVLDLPDSIGVITATGSFTLDDDGTEIVNGETRNVAEGDHFLTLIMNVYTPPNVSVDEGQVNYHFEASVVPEPAPASLLSFFLLGLPFFMSRRLRHPASQ